MIRTLLIRFTFDSPATLARGDWVWSKDVRFDGSVLDHLPKKRSEYWARNCWAGMSLASRAEVEARAQIGIDRMMFGVDFPHVESTYPNTLATVQTITQGLSEPDVRAFLGLNAAELWDIDTKSLAPVIDEVGFTISEVRELPPSGTELNDDVVRPMASYHLRTRGSRVRRQEGRPPLAIGDAPADTQKGSE